MISVPGSAGIEYNCDVARHYSLTEQQCYSRSILTKLLRKLHGNLNED